MVRMEVYRIGVTERGEAVVILADLEGERMLPIWIGLFEANSIAMEMRGEKFERPLTHDLFHNVLRRLEHDLERVEVTRLEGGTFYADLWWTDGEEITTVDARPSDALALALRFGSEIYVDEEVLAQAQIAPEALAEQDEDEEQAFRSLMERITFQGNPELMPETDEAEPPEQPGTQTEDDE